MLVGCYHVIVSNAVVRVGNTAQRVRTVQTVTGGLAVHHGIQAARPTAGLNTLLSPHQHRGTVQGGRLQQQNITIMMIIITIIITIITIPRILC